MTLRECLKVAGMVLAGALLSASHLASAAIDDAARVNALADELLAHLRAGSAYVRLQSGLPITEFDAITFEHAQDEAKFHKRMLARVNAIELDKLPHEPWLLAKMLHHTFASGAQADENYWLDFTVTPYAGGLNINDAHSILAQQPLKSAADLEHYLHLLDSYAVMLEQIAVKTRAQAERGIRVSKPAIPGVIDLFRKLHASAADTLVPAQARITGVSARESSAFNAAIRKRIGGRIGAAYDAVAAIFDDDYVRRAPDEVGISRYPGGKQRYLRFIAAYTGLALTPQQIHELGERGVAELDTQMQAIRAQVGFKGDRDAFHRMLLKDPRFLARTPEEVGKRLLAHVARIEPRIPQYFSKLPRARYGVKRLDPVLEKSATFGYYNPPTPAEPIGYYYYNGSDLEERSLFAAAHLIFHELLPGHHLQLALQLENTETHPVRKFLENGAFAEGWAEYAASLGKEMGLFSDPYDLYGQIVYESFFATRLVVDTGMNYLGWSLAQGRAYMKAHVLNSDTEIASETLRYSTDYFAQALNYRLGYEKFWELRKRAEQALGADFDIRDFHAAALGGGSMSLDVLDGQIDWFIAQHRH